MEAYVQYSVQNPPEIRIVDCMIYYAIKALQEPLITPTLLTILYDTVLLERLIISQLRNKFSPFTPCRMDL